MPLDDRQGERFGKFSCDDVFDEGWRIERRSWDEGEDYQDVVAHLETERLADLLLVALTRKTRDSFEEGVWY